MRSCSETQAEWPPRDQDLGGGGCFPTPRPWGPWPGAVCWCVDRVCPKDVLGLAGSGRKRVTEDFVAFVAWRLPDVDSGLAVPGLASGAACRVEGLTGSWLAALRPRRDVWGFASTPGAPGKVCPDVLQGGTLWPPCCRWGVGEEAGRGRSCGHRNWTRWCPGKTGSSQSVVEEGRGAGRRREGEGMCRWQPPGTITGPRAGATPDDLEGHHGNGLCPNTDRIWGPV